MTTLVETHSLTWNVTPDLLGILSDTGVFVDTNPSWLHTLGWEADEIKRRTFYDFLHPDDIADNAAAFEEIKTGKPILGFENRYRHKDGTYRWLSWNAVPEGAHFFCSARDITKAKNNAASLRSREQEALLREQFVAVLGHDLRNPLATIRSAARIMGREEQSDRTRDMITAIEGSVDRMTALIGDLMDFARSKLGSGLEVAATEEHDIVAVVTQVIDEIDLAHPARKVVRKIDFEGRTRFDKTRMSQLVSNLLGNAMAHGDPSLPVTIKLWQTKSKLRLSVANGGPAIDEDKLNSIFEPFFTADPDTHKKGLGLGLFIVSQIAQAHHGEMSVTSDDAQTVFEFSMPLTQTH